MATRNGHVEVIGLLLANRANVNAADPVLCHTVHHTHPPIYTTPREQPSDAAAVMRYSASGDAAAWQCVSHCCK
jgi:hypothetical protein